VEPRGRVVHLHAGLGAHGAQLLARRRPLHVGRDQQGVAPRPASHRPSLAVVVVLPTLEPVIRITLGGCLALSSGFASGPPRTSTISSRTMRRTAWSGERL